MFFFLLFLFIFKCTVTFRYLFIFCIDTAWIEILQYLVCLKKIFITVLPLLAHTHTHIYIQTLLKKWKQYIQKIHFYNIHLQIICFVLNYSIRWCYMFAKSCIVFVNKKYVELFELCSCRREWPFLIKFFVLMWFN